MKYTILKYLHTEWGRDTYFGDVNVSFEEWINSMSNMDLLGKIDAALENMFDLPSKDND